MSSDKHPSIANTLSPSLFRGERLLVWTLWVGAFLLFLYHFIYIPATTQGIDYLKHWQAAEGIPKGNSPYVEPYYHGFNYPLFTALPFFYLAFIDSVTGSWLWDIGNSLFILSAGILFAWALPVSQTKTTSMASLENKCLSFLSNNWKPIILFTTFSYQPAQQGSLWANIEPFNLLLSSLFCFFFIQRKDTWCGIFLTVFTLIKLAPILLIIPLFVTKRYKPIIICIAILCVYGFFLLISGYWQWEIVLYREVVPRIPWQWQSISGSVHLFIADSFFPQALETPKAFQGLIFKINIVLLALYGSYLAAWWKWSQRNANALLLLGYQMILLFSPLLEVIHFSWIFPSFILLLYLWSKNQLNNYWAILNLTTWLLVTSTNTINQLFMIVNKDDYYLEHLPWAIILIVHVVTSAGVAWTARQPSPTAHESSDSELAINNDPSPTN